MKGNKVVEPKFEVGDRIYFFGESAVSEGEYKLVCYQVMGRSVYHYHIAPINPAVDEEPRLGESTEPSIASIDAYFSGSPNEAKYAALDVIKRKRDREIKRLREEAAREKKSVRSAYLKAVYG